MRYLKIFIIVLCLSLFVIPASQAGETLKLAMSTWVGYGPLHLAKSKAFYKEAGVDVELILMEDPNSRFAALAAGRIDGLATTIDTVILQSKSDVPLSIVLALDDSKGGDGIVATKGLNTLADLKGKKVAYNEGSTSDFWLTVLLQKNGLSKKDIESVNMTAGDSGAAFVAKKVDAAVTWEPWLTRGKQAEHGHLLIDSSTTPGLIVDILVIRQDVLKERGEDIKKVVKAWNRAVDFWKTNPEEANELMAKSVGGWLKDAKVFAGTLTGIKYYDKGGNLQFFGTKDKPGSIYKTAQYAIDVWKSFGKLKWSPKPEDLITPAFLESK